MEQMIWLLGQTCVKSSLTWGLTEQEKGFTWFHMVTGQASGKGVPLKYKLNVLSLFFKIKTFQGAEGSSFSRPGEKGRQVSNIFTQ